MTEKKSNLHTSGLLKYPEVCNSKTNTGRVQSYLKPSKNPVKTKTKPTLN